MNQTASNFMSGAELAWANFVTFLPKLGMFILIIVAGYFIAKWVGKLVNAILERVGFDRLVERGGIKRALERTRYDASDILAKIVFYFIFLFVLQLAFGVFGPNPISELLTQVIAFLPNLFVAVLIVIVASAVAAAVKEIVQVALGGLSYGRILARLAAAAIVVVGVFAALSQIGIAPAIVNGLFYAGLAIIAGCTIVAVGGGGIAPMRGQWEKALRKIEQEAPKIRAEAQGGAQRVEERAEAWKRSAETATTPRTAPYQNPKP
jgi:hypothetical protein